MSFKYAIIAFVATLLISYAAQKAFAADRPNIVFILVDDLRFDDLGYTGHPFSKTPVIDRLAGEGLNFTNMFATTPLCSPSRASILTGLHTSAHGITDNTERSPATFKLDTFPKHLHDAGYRTAWIGKWHMGNDDSPRPGFDRWICMKGQGDSNDASFNIDGKQVKTAGYVTDVMTKYVTDFIKESKAAGDKPFLAYVSHKALHPQTQQDANGKLSDPNADNFIPAERHKDLYKNDPLPRRPNYAKPPTDKPALMQSIEGLKPLGAETISSDRSIKDRLRMLVAIDESTGVIMDALRETGQLENTLIVVTGDHGYWYGEHGLSVERRLAYEEGIRIPLVMWNPKLIPTPRKIESTVETLDLAPTFLEIGQAAPLAKQHGLSLVPLIRGQAFPEHRDVMVQYYTDTVFPRVRNMGYSAIRSDRWKYIHYKELTGADELYDLASDPYELKNLASDPGGAKELELMKQKLAAAIDAAK